MFSIAAIWLALSELFLPAAYTSSAPSFFACALAPSFIFTKNGFVTSFVIRPTLIVAVCFEVLALATAARTALTARTRTSASSSGRPLTRDGA
jgi:hypothetical protein